MMKSDEEKKVKHCPNCGDTNIKRVGNEVLCFTCNCIFMITDKGEARVKKIGALNEIQERLDRIEQKVFEPAEPAGPETPDKSENGWDLFGTADADEGW